MDLQLNGRRALVTGSTAGIGFAIARTLAAEGSEVFVNGRGRDRVDAAIERIRGEQANAHVSGVVADVSDAAGVRKLTGAVDSVDILVNNVGIFEPKDFQDIGDDDWLRFFQANVMSGVRLARHYLPAMKERDWGRIVFISSESGIHIPVEMLHYGMTKAAQLAVSRGLAETTAGTGVTVNAVLPGPTRSEGVGTFIEQLAQEQGKSQADVEAEFIAENRPTSLIRRLAEPQETANLVAYVCSPLSSATNGAALRVDGGVVRTMV